MRTVDTTKQMSKYVIVSASAHLNSCSHSFFAISWQHVTVVNIYSRMDAAIVIFIQSGPKSGAAD